MQISVDTIVDTIKGKVILNEAIDSQKNIDKAKEVASAVGGVKKVKNK